MRRWISILLFAVLLSGINTSCRSFDRIGNPGETYTSRYNLPGQRIVPYTNPNQLYDGNSVVDVCDLVKTEEGVECI